MNKSLLTLSSEIISLWNKETRSPSEASTVDEEHTEEEDKHKIIFNQFDTLFAKMYDPSNPPERLNELFSAFETLVRPYKEHFLANGMILDATELLSYLFTRSQRNRVACSHYLFNDAYLEQLESKYDENTEYVSFIDLVCGWECKTCGLSDNQHHACGYYNPLSDREIACASCGLYRSNHSVCSGFVLSDAAAKRDCAICGLGRSEHIKASKKVCCGNQFVNDGTDHCLNCMYNLQEHFYKPHYFELDESTQNKLMTSLVLFNLNMMDNQELPNDEWSLQTALLNKVVADVIYNDDYKEIMKRSVMHRTTSNA